MLFFAEPAILACLLFFAFVFPHRGGKRIRAVVRPLLRWVIRRRWVAILTTGALALAINMTIALTVRWPHPSIHDEFSYLLASDTFAQGRLTNPAHPMWQHLETFHVIHQPTYQSKYPPAQGLVLALGQALVGYPIVGVWLSVALACAGTCWMLQGWVRPRWALLGGLLMALHPQLTIWGQNFWGGAVAVLGSALLFGAMRRLVRQPRMLDGVVLGVGLAILANSRPYEGLVASVPVAVVLLCCLLRPSRYPLSITLPRMVLPTLLVLLITAIAMGYYHYRVTRSPWRMPYQTYTATYSAQKSVLTSIFFWQYDPDSPLEPERRLPIPGPQVPDVPGKTLGGKLAHKGFHAWLFFLRFYLLLPLVMLIRPLRDRWTWFALIVLALGFLAYALQSTQAHQHYLAPIVPMLFYLIVQGWRFLWVCRPWHEPVGQMLATLLPVAIALTLLMTIAEWYTLAGKELGNARASLAQLLKEKPGKDLVIVRYQPNHRFHAEWVYNEANIDESPIVWAHDLGEEPNKKLIDYFKDRQVWLLQADVRPLKLVPYCVKKQTIQTDSFTQP